MKGINMIKNNPHIIMHKCYMLNDMSFTAVLLTITVLICAVLFLPLKLEACGWAGEDEFDEVIEEIIIGADVLPVPETEGYAYNPATMTRLGNLYRIGESVPKDYSKALNLYRKAAEADQMARQELE
jgi:TPR repeat protein